MSGVTTGASWLIAGRALVVVATLASCSSPSKSAANHGAPITFTSIHTSSSNPRLLLVPVAEPSKNHRAFCWTYYRAQATESGSRVQVILTNTTRPTSAESLCDTSPRSYYVPVTLAAPYAGQPVTDATSGLAVRVGRPADPGEAYLVQAQ
jgi:hypothetical protein